MESSNYNYNMFCTKLRWAISEKTIKDITDFQLGNFSYKINMNIDKLKRFSSFLDDFSNKSKLPLPMEICNFFIKEEIDFKIKYKYIKGFGLKHNYHILKYFWFLKKEIAKIKQIQEEKENER